MSVMPCTGVTFVKKNSCLVARTVSFDTAGLHLLTFRILDTYLSKDIELDLSHVISYIFYSNYEALLFFKCLFFKK